MSEHTLPARRFAPGGMAGRPAGHPASTRTVGSLTAHDIGALVTVDRLDSRIVGQLRRVDHDQPEVEVRSLADVETYLAKAGPPETRLTLGPWEASMPSDTPCEVHHP